MPDYSIYGRILITQAFDFFETPDSLFSSLLKDYSFNLNFSNEFLHTGERATVVEILLVDYC